MIVSPQKGISSTPLFLGVHYIPSLYGVLLESQWHQIQHADVVFLYRFKKKYALKVKPLLLYLVLPQAKSKASKVKV